MELLIFGHSGARVLVFPTSKGKYYEWEDRGMIRALSHQINNGWLQVYCVDSVDTESWYAQHKHPGARAWRQEEYQNYLLYEVLPLSKHKNQNPFLITAGASFGAYQAVNFALRYPHRGGRPSGMSGIYDMSRWSESYHGEFVYRNNPCWYIPQEHDWGRLQALRHLDIILAVGRDDSVRGNNEHLSSLLWQKEVGNALRLWHGWSHDWPYWLQMIQLYIGGHD
jgi:esterase/lipase superfamily enzyme